MPKPGSYTHLVLVAGLFPDADVAEAQRMMQLDAAVVRQRNAGVGVHVALSLIHISDMWLKRFWELPMRTGKRRYYDNCLYFFSLLMLSGQYRTWVE